MNLAGSIVAFLLIPFCVLVHFLLATQYEIYEIRPIWAIIIICASLIVLLRLLIRTKEAGVGNHHITNLTPTTPLFSPRPGQQRTPWASPVSSAILADGTGKRTTVAANQTWRATGWPPQRTRPAPTWRVSGADSGLAARTGPIRRRQAEADAADHYHSHDHYFYHCH